MEGPGDKVYPYDTLCTQYVKDRVYPEDAPGMLKALSLETVRKKMKVSNEYVSGYRVLENGEIHYCQFTYIPINPLDKSAGILAGFKNVDDVVAGAREREHLITLAETDLMTGLYNRGVGEQKVCKAMEEGSFGMFCIIDIDGFKRFNDTYGHNVGDKVIKGIAETLKEQFRKTDIVFRLGGDEFAVFAPGVSDVSRGKRLINRVLKRIGGLNIEELTGEKPTVSVGAVFTPSEGPLSFEDAYRKADSCVYRSKENPGNTVSFCE